MFSSAQQEVVAQLLAGRRVANRLLVELLSNAVLV